MGTVTRRQGESRIRWLKRIAGTFVLQGFPAFRSGDRVAIVDDAAVSVLGDDTSTIAEVVAPFYGWEYRVVANDPEDWIPTRYPDEGTLLAAEQIEPISAKENDQ